MSNSLENENKLLKQEIKKLKSKLDQKQGECNLLQQIIDNVDAHIYWKDIDGKVLGINKSNLKALKINSIEEVIGKTDSELHIDKSFQDIMRNDLQVIKEGKSFIFEETYVIDNETVYLLSTKNCLKDSKENIIGIVGVSVDITDRKKLEEKLKQKDVLKTQFIENFSHDVKVPINALVGRTQLLKLLGHRDKNEKIIRAAETADNSAMVLDTLFTQMQDIMIHEKFDKKIYNTEFNLSDLVKKEIEITEASISPHKNININFIPNESLSTQINTDHYKLSQIIRNLLSNAIKFTDEGNINIKTEIVEKESNKINFKFTVSDTGIGIDANQQNNIFDIFDRAGITSHDDNRHGMGIGLYIVKNNLDILGGDIKFESHLGQGSRFSIEIPLNKA